MTLKTETEKIRVCFISPKAYPLFNRDIQTVFGGAEVDTYMIGTELAKDEHFEVSFVVADYGQPEQEVRENVCILKSLDFGQNPIGGALKIWKSLKQADADIYMMKTPSAGVLLVQYFCQKHQKHFIYKTANQGECDGTYLSKRPLLGRFFLRSLRKTSTVIVQNQQDHDNLTKLYHLNSEIIPNGHQIPKNDPQNKKTILWVGRSADIKKPRRFLKLAKAFPKKPFVMVCQEATGDNCYKSLRSKAGQIENLTFLEHVSFDKIDAYFEQAKIFVNTSDSEGFPNTFIQACKAQTAILSYVVNPDGFLDTYHCGINCHGNETTLMDQLRNMLGDDRCLELGRNGRDYVTEKHDLVKIIERYKTIFKSLKHH